MGLGFAGTSVDYGLYLKMDDIKAPQKVRSKHLDVGGHPGGELQFGFKHLMRENMTLQDQHKMATLVSGIF